MSIVLLPAVTITPSEYMKCVDEFEQLGCDDWLYGGEYDKCEGFSGALPDGSPCSADIQCARGTCATNLGCGACGALTAAGESCLGRRCDTGLECSSDYICIEARYLGEPCDGDSPCSLTLTCIGGVCAKRGSEGTPCAGGSLACDYVQGLTCGETNLCEPIPLPVVGEACKGICRRGSVCNHVGRCVATLSDGQACTSDEGVDICDGSLECIEGVCSPLNPASCG
jgi:hypothetical protein